MKLKLISLVSDLLVFRVQSIKYDHICFCSGLFDISVNGARAAVVGSNHYAVRRSHSYASNDQCRLPHTDFPARLRRGERKT
jgi:hypothetical protein